MSAIVYQTDRITGDATAALAGTEGFAVSHLVSASFLFIGARGASSINVYEFSSSGRLTYVQDLGPRSNRLLDGVGELATVSLPDDEYLLTTSLYDNAFQGYRVTANGTLRVKDYLQDDVIRDPTDDSPGVSDGGDALALYGADSIVGYDVGGVAHFAVGAAYDGGVTILRYLEGGVIEHVSNTFDTADFHLSGVEDIALAETSFGRFLISVSPDEEGVSVFQVSDAGALTNTFNLATGPEISLGVLTTAATVSIGDQTFVFIAGRGNWPISAFKLEADGTLTLTDRVTGSEAVNLFNTYALTAFQAEGKTFLAAGSDRGGVSIFRVGDNGALSLVHEDGHLNRRVETTDALHVEQFDGKTYLIAGGGIGDGVTVSRFFASPKGDGVVGSAANETLIGTPKGDILIGDGGNDRIKGKSGHDRILDGPGKDLVWGGPGRDVFEFIHDDKQDKLRDFQDGFDLIDLSDAPDIDDIGDLVFTQMNANNVRIEIDGELLFVRGYQNSPLAIAQFGDDDFIF